MSDMNGNGSHAQYFDGSHQSTLRNHAGSHAPDEAFLQNISRTSPEEERDRVATAGAPPVTVSTTSMESLGRKSDRPLTIRAKSDYGPSRGHNFNGNEEEEETDDEDEGEEEEDDREVHPANVKMRHGWESQLTNEEQTSALARNFFMYWTDKRHETAGKAKETGFQVQEWRMRDRLKTVGALLAVCLNVGVDPPDVIKTDPCARMECWIDPMTDTSSGSGQSGVTSAIGKALQAQFEGLSMRTRYKLVMDPSVDDMKKFCTTLRRTSKDERILFYYNGHGVPRPTQAGEIWVFNRSFTQYIPITLYDLQSWLGAPGLFLYDCSSAGLIIKNFHNFVKKHEAEQNEAKRKDPTVALVNYSDCIHLAACKENEVLPSNPDLPADLFTSCLTTPIEMAVRFYILQNPLPLGPSLEEGRHIPGKISERRTPLGELNWIFTAITDTIAWNSLPKPLFKKLFRQDLMVAALFRNFLLAQRIMRVYHCHPQCHPEIPDTHSHPLWQSWDYALENILQQLPKLIEMGRDNQELEYRHSDFFAQQLTAFEVYLTQGALEQKIPEQLPIVLQVLLSQVHRLRALILLSRFLDLGPWAVNLALSIGIFPYVLKLLQSQAQELKPVMVFIWARILAIDQTCQGDLLKDNGYQYFINILNPQFPINMSSSEEEHRAMCAYIISMFCKDFRPAQNVCLSSNPELMEHLMVHLSNFQHPLLRQHACLCIGMLWKDFPEAKWHGVRIQAHLRLCQLGDDAVPEVRTAMLTALTNFIGIPDLTDQVAEIESEIAGNLVSAANDGNVMVRKEYLVFLSTFVHRYKARFVVAAFNEMVDERKKQVPSRSSIELNGSFDRRTSHSGSESPEHIQRNSSSASSYTPSQNVFAALWRQVLTLSADPHPEIAQNTCIILDYVLEALFNGQLGRSATKVMDDLVQHERQTAMLASQPLDVSRHHSRGDLQRGPPSPTPSSSSKHGEGYFSAGLRRTASMAASIANLAAFGASKEKGDPPTPGPPGLKESIPSSLRGPQHARQRSQMPSEWSKPPDASDPHPANSRYIEAKAPSVRGFEPRDLTKAPELPLTSSFFKWSASYFREPQMRSPETEEPGSIDFNERIWRRSRNDRIMLSTQPLKDMAANGRWNVPAGVLANGAATTKMIFHQFENHLVVADDRDGVTVWDWAREQRLARFSNTNPAGSRITDLRFINEDDVALLMIGSSDGVVKIYRNYDDRKKIELASSFRALTDLVDSTHNAGLVFDWQQGQGRLLVAGDLRVIRVWQAGTEHCISDIPARSGSNITSLTSDQVEGNVFVAGFGDGAVRVYDQRNRPNESMVKVWKEHKGWIVGCHLQRGGMRELISAERAGPVRLWDIRMDRSVGVVKGKGEGGVGTCRTLSVHEHAPVFAT